MYNWYSCQTWRSNVQIILIADSLSIRLTNWFHLFLRSWAFSLTSCFTQVRAYVHVRSCFGQLQMHQEREKRHCTTNFGSIATKFFLYTPSYLVLLLAFRCTLIVLTFLTNKNPLNLGNMRLICYFLTDQSNDLQMFCLTIQ